MEALACCEIREEEDSRGQRVAGMVQPLRPALAESTAALAEMTARLGGAAGAGAAGAAAGRILKPRSRPLPTHPGMKYFREETLALDLARREMHRCSPYATMR